MAGQPPKLQHVDDADTELQTQKTKAWQYPPEFWDRLSETSLTRLALKTSVTSVFSSILLYFRLC